MTLAFTPQAILTALWKVTTEPGQYFIYGLRAKYENYDIYYMERHPQFNAYEFDLCRITRFVEEAGGVDTDKPLGVIRDMNFWLSGGKTEVTFFPDESLPISDLAPVILDCKKAGMKISISDGSDLSKLINTAALLVEP